MLILANALATNSETLMYSFSVISLNISSAYNFLSALLVHSLNPLSSDSWSEIIINFCLFRKKDILEWK